MIEAKDLRIGNVVIEDNGSYKDYFIVSSINSLTRTAIDNEENITSIEYLIPIPLTEEILIKAGFETLNHMIVTNYLIKNIGRNRIISIGSIGTPNEMIWLCEIDMVNQTKIIDLVCIRNYDYDGKTHVHQLQNIHFSLTGEELTINL